MNNPLEIAQFLERIADEYKLDVQDIIIQYNKRSGVLEIMKNYNPPIIIGKIEVNDL
jgi:diketogulonate reductase-like aldo/keto reductase